MNRELLRQALQECRQEQTLNRAKEEERLLKASAACPRIGELVAARRNAILSGLQSALSGTAPRDLVQDTNRANAEIKKLLTENGFAPNYLEPIYTCPLCRDTGYVGEHKKAFCPCVIKRCDKLLSESLEMPETGECFESFDPGVFSDAPLDGLDFSQREYAQVLRDKCEAYAGRLPGVPVPNLLFYGKSGLGKTFLLRSIARRAQERGVPALSVTANTLLNAIRKSYFSHEDDGLAPFYQTQLLLIDDLGTEPLWENITVEQLFALLDARFSARRNTVISTNLSLRELQQRYTERIASRLLDARLCQAVRFLGSDIRRRP